MKIVEEHNMAYTSRYTSGYTLGVAQNIPRGIPARGILYPGVYSDLSQTIPGYILVGVNLTCYFGPDPHGLYVRGVFGDLYREMQ